MNLRSLSLPLALLLAAVPAQARFFRTVVIDPGHGGHDKGGQWGLVYEKHLALDTSVRLESELKKRGLLFGLHRRIVGRHGNFRLFKFDSVVVLGIASFN